MHGPARLTVSLVLLFAAPLVAGSAKAPRYPLHIQVRIASGACTDCNRQTELWETEPGNGLSGAPHGSADLDNHYTGQSSGVILLGADKTQAFFFVYSGCLDPLPISNTPIASLAARWKKPGQLLEVLVPMYSPHKPVDFASKHLSKCVLDLSPQKRVNPHRLRPPFYPQ